MKVLPSIRVVVSKPFRFIAGARVSTTTVVPVISEWVMVFEFPASSAIVIVNVGLPFDAY